MTKHLPDIQYQSITEIAPRIRNGDLSPVDLVDSLLRQISRLEPSVNAFLEVWSDSARTAARLAEGEIKSGRYIGPLHGIPIGLKDLIDVAERKTTGGSKVLADNIANSDATVVKRLKAAGAILMGKLNLVEFAFGTTGLNPYTGDVKNPWDKTRITAGSSSGSAAAVACGMIPGSLGSDTGGSIRMPASVCGIAGLKPTYGRIPRTGVLDLSWSMDHIGPMARTTEDCALLLNALAGSDNADLTSYAGPTEDFTSQLKKGLGLIRIGVPTNYFFEDPVDPEISEAVLSSINTMVLNGAEVVEVSMPWVDKGRAINLGVIRPEAVSVHESLMAENANLYTPDLRRRIQSGSSITAIDYIHAQRARQWFNQQMSESMKQVDVLITPTVPIQTPTIKQCKSDKNGEAASQLPMFTSVFDVTGQPSHSIPCGFTSGGMPIGMMITGHPYDEKTVLRVGNAFEKLTRWHQRVPADIPEIN